MLVRPEVADDRRSRRAARRYRRAVRWAFDRVSFYRDQCAVAGRLLSEPQPTPLASVPKPPHTLCPFSRPWRPDREPSLWTPDLGRFRPRRMVVDSFDLLFGHSWRPLNATHLVAAVVLAGLRHHVVLSRHPGPP